MKRKAKLLLLTTILGAITLEATPPVKKFYGHRQPNGSVVMIQKHGDGLQGFYSTPEGMPLLLNEEGVLCYAEKSGSKAICSSNIYSNSLQAPAAAITSVSEMSKVISHALSIEQSKAYTQSRALNAVNTDGLGTYGKSGNGCVKSIGEIRIPVVMVQFPDKPFAESTTQEKVSRMLNEKGYADENFCKGSVKDYFEPQSSELFSPSFEIVATVTADESYAYYGKNSGSSIDTGCKKLINEAINKAEAQGADFNQFTVDGKVPLINIYYAGPGEHSSFEAGCENYLWAHFSEYSITSKNNVRFNSYFIGNEIFQNYKQEENGELVVTESKIDGIGVFCHEFSHALGMPDFYYTGSNATTSDTLHTMDFWSLMDYGQYAYDGYAPVPYTAYEKCYMGWLDIAELTQDSVGEKKLFAVENTEGGNTAYLIRNDNNRREYYILENRQLGSWHPNFLGSGMLVLHVDYNANEWTYNRPNNDPQHQRMQYVPADNVKQSNSSKNGWNDYKGDLFPGITYIYNLTDTTLPATTTFTGGYLGKPIYDISETDGVITFYYLTNKEASAINEVRTDNATKEAYYDLSGRIVKTPFKNHLYIKEGKTILYKK